MGQKLTKSRDEIEDAEKTVRSVDTEAERIRELESIYEADEAARSAAGRALLENPVATTGMMIQMRSRETTGARCLRNKVISMRPGDNFALKIKDLEAVSVHDANRLRRLFDCGCPKQIVYWLACFHNKHADRNQFITEEEAKLYLEPLAEPLFYPQT